MSIVGGLAVAPARIRPSYVPILNACITLIEDGKPPTFANIARVLHRHRNAVQQLFQRHPDLWDWIGGYVDGSLRHYVPMVLKRHAILGIQGSVESAKVFLAGMNVLGGRRGAQVLNGEDDDDGLLEDTRCVVNILVPHPQLPEGGRMPEPSALPALPKDIPTVAVR